MFYINDYGGFWIELLPLLIRSNNIVKIYDDKKRFWILLHRILTLRYQKTDIIETYKETINIHL